MDRKFGYWLCPKCKHQGKNDHIHALNDYYLLIGDTITNKQARDFLMLTSRTTMRDILYDLEYEKIGNLRGRKYKLRFIEPK